MSNSTACVFCAIIHFGAPVTDLRRHGNDAVSFVPLNPVTAGHRLFVPTVHIDHRSKDFALYAGRVAEYAAEHGMSLGQDSNIMMNVIVNNGPDATQTIPHLHWHVVPRRPGDGLALPWTGQH